MANKLYTSIPNKIVIKPIRGVSFWYTKDGDSEFTSLVIDHLESESSYKIDAMTKTSSLGRTITYGYKFEATLYVPFNESDIIDDLEEAMSYNVQIHIALGKTVIAAMEPYTAPKHYNATGSGEIVIPTGKAQISFNVESAEFRPRTIINIVYYTSKLSDIYY